MLKVKNANIICYRLMSLVTLSRGNNKKNLENWWKSMKIANIDRESLHNFWTTRKNAIKFLEKVWILITFKVLWWGFHSPFRRYIF